MQLIIKCNIITGKTLTGTLKVYIDDVNDNYPVFTHDNLTVDIKSSEMYEGMFIVNVTAKDKDLGKNGYVYYFKKDTYDQDYESFRIDCLTGLFFLFFF